MSTKKAALAATIMRRAWAVLLACALCLGLTPALARADEGGGEAETFSVALTVVDSTDPAAGALANVRVDGMTADGTVADLLASQGFSAGDQGASAADASGRTYFESYGAPCFLGKGYDAATGCFWASMYDGDGVADYASALLSAKLRPNGHYQYVYGTDSAFAYSAGVPQLVSAAVNNPLPAASDPDPAPDPSPEQGAPVAVGDEVYRDLFSAVQASFAGTSAEWQAMELAAAGKASEVDVPALVEAALVHAADPGNTDLQRGIIALTAVGVDATAVPASGGGTVNLIELMAASPIAASTVNSKMFMLLAYESGPYAVPLSALKSKDQLIADVLAAQLQDGGYAYSGASGESDMTAMAVASLAPYRADAGVSGAIDRAVGRLRALQLPNGGFSSPYDADPSAVNVGSTAFVVVALSALGIDAAADAAWTTESGGTPLAALLTQASGDRTGFLFEGSLNELATEQGFRALVAYQGLKNTGAAYNVYTQARLGQAALPVDQKQDGVPSAPAASLAKTADGAVAVASAATALALAALAAAATAVARSRVRPAREATRRR